MNLFRKQNRRKRKVRLPGGRLVSLFLPLGAGVVVAALMINLGLTQFLVRGYLGEDGFAVPQGSLSVQLRNADPSAEVSLLKVDMGDAIYTRAIGSKGYFIGEEKTAISSGYPLFTREGQVLYFLDDSLNMVTQDWEVLSSYGGLYLSDGVTYNADNIQADLEQVLLVQVDGGYQLAQKAVVTSAMRGHTIPMNAVCAFGKTEIVYYSCSDNVLRGSSLRMAEGATITIGEDTYGYEDFLKRLGLWEEKPEKEPQPTEEPTPGTEPTEEPTPSPSPTPTPSSEPSVNPEPSGNPGGSEDSDQPEIPPSPAPADPAQPGEKPSKQPTGDKEPKPPSDVTEEPAPPKDNPNSTPEAPATPSGPSGGNNDSTWKEPTVAFQGLEPWVYTLSTQAQISDPSGVLRNGGVQLYVYQVENEHETRILRQTATTTGTVIIGQLPPAQQYHVVAEYTYKDAKGINRTKTLDLGSATTLGYDALNTIEFSIRDESGHVLTEEDRVQVFSNCLQGRDLVFSNISNGLVTEESASTRPAAVKTNMTECYVNTITLMVSENNTSIYSSRAAGQTAELKLSGRALQLLCSGYTLSHWESENKLKAGTQYTYTISMKDRYGVELPLRTNQENYAGHTCKTTPSVKFSVPDATNVVNSTRVTVTLKNPDLAAITEEAQLGLGGKAALYLLKKGEESSGPQRLSAYRLDERGNHIDADGNVVNDTQADTFGTYLPIEVNENGAVSAATTWVIKDLEPYTTYIAAVVCGSYDIEDGRVHMGENLEVEGKNEFMTVSLRSRVSYVSTVDEITHNSARLKFRLNETNAELIPLIDELTFALEERSGSDVGSITLRKADLDQVQYSIAGRPSGYKLSVPAYVAGETNPRMVEIEILWNDTMPDLPAGVGTDMTLWNFLLATAGTSESDGCWLALRLGAQAAPAADLFTLKPVTRYQGEFTTKATLGGKQIDVTSTTSRKVSFQTLNEEAVVWFDNVFVSSDFIELYGLKIADEGGCILKDVENRGGNVAIRVYEYHASATIKVGRQVQTVYINSADYAQESVKPLRLTGLSTETDYVLIFEAQRYSNGEDAAALRNRALSYAEPDENLDDPSWFVFRTDKSVSGSLELMGINQQYYNQNGELTNSLSILGENDFYLGVWQDDRRLVCRTDEKDELVAAYKEQLESKELIANGGALTAAQIELLKTNLDNISSKTPATTNDTQVTANVWTSRFIAVTPGEKYSIYNIDSLSDPRIIFFYSDNGGQLTYYNEFSAGAYMRGGVFRVPGQAKDGRTFYMRISGRNQQMRSGLIIEKYDENRTAGAENLGKNAGLMKEMYINTSNNTSVNRVYAYVADYIGGIIGGSVYELKGRDLNKPDNEALNGEYSSVTEDAVLFYDENFVFLGGYTVCNQTALVKAPFGAAYCRFAVRMKQTDSGMAAPSWENGMSIKLYKRVVEDQYAGALRLNLKDESDNVMLANGSYSVVVYQTEEAVSDTDDLSLLSDDAWSEFYRLDVGVGSEAVDITSLISVAGMPMNCGFKAVLTIRPGGWSTSVVLDTTYFTTNRVVGTISTLGELMAIRSNPAGSYVVTADITGLTGYVLSSDRPFTGVIDFQGHSVTTTGFNALFYRVSETGVVKNLEIKYNAYSSSTTSAPSSAAPVAVYNYGVLQNIVVRYNASTPGYGADVYVSGGLCMYNYGTIDGFIVEFLKDIRVIRSFGGVCMENRGLICNGYVVCEELTDQGRRAALIHKYKNDEGVLMEANSYNISLGVGLNQSRGTVRNMYVVGEIIVESATAESCPDLTTTDVDNSTKSTNTVALVVGQNRGQLDYVYSTGDRWDYGIDVPGKEVMLQRGPAVGYVEYMYHAENVTYFSNYTYEENEGVSTVGKYNVKGENESLYEYQWHEAYLGEDGTRFRIRELIEDEVGYYPQLILPDCFGVDFQQPKVPLFNCNMNKVEILYNEVCVQGIDHALVTVSMSNPTGEEVMGIEMFDDDHADPLDYEILSQGKVGNTYQVDVLISLAKDEGGNYIHTAQDQYAIRNVILRRGTVPAFDKRGERIVRAAFWKEIAGKEDWRAYFVDTNSSTITGNYLLTADIDFSESETYQDWYCSLKFCGALDGGIYTTASVTLTDYMGNVITDVNGDPRSIVVRDRLLGMHSVSGVGNMNAAGNYDERRNGNEYTNSLFRQFYGTLENVVFQNFRSVKNPSVRYNNGNAYLSGVIAYAGTGARIDNCHVRDSVFYGRHNIGALVAEAAGVNITNSSAGGVAIETVRINNATETMNVGGLVGYISNSGMENCFVAGVKITAADVYNSNGLGGMIGYMYNTTVENCYSTGTVNMANGTKSSGVVDAGFGRVGGLIGQMTGESVLSGCWSTTTVMTAADYAGGLVGYHAGGQMVNNYTAGTLITRSLAATSVHRICNNINFDEINRHDNYAFAGQYLTYTMDPSEVVGNESIYQFGIWDRVDGATALLSVSQLKEVGTWVNQIGLSSSAFDFTGSAGIIISMGTSMTDGCPFSGADAVRTSISAGSMPKLRHTDTGVLLYDQRNVEVGYDSSSLLSRIAITMETETTFKATLAFFSQREDLQELSLEQWHEDMIADWENMTVIGGQVVNPGEIVLGNRCDSIDSAYGDGRYFSFTVDFGDSDGRIGHFLDSYILSLPVYKENPFNPDGSRKEAPETEILQVRLGLDSGQPVYKTIGSLDAWNDFFKPSSGHANFYENILLTNDIEFIVNEDGSMPEGQYINIKLNRLKGQSANGNVTISTKQINGETVPIILKQTGASLISQVATKISDVYFKNINLQSAVYNDQGVPTSRWGGDNKGVIGMLQGDIENVTFEKIRVDGGNSSSVGMIGTLYGKAENVTLKGVRVRSRYHYVGGLVGKAEDYSTITDVHLSAGEDGTRNEVISDTGYMIGGVVGYMLGIGSDITVDETDVYGREYVGGVAGYATGNGNRPTERKLRDVVVGSGGKADALATDVPGVLQVRENGSYVLKPSVTVTVKVLEATASGLGKAGGAVGYGGGQQLRNLEVYNTMLSVDYDANLMTVSNSGAGTYSFYMGGVVGTGGGGMQDSTAENCTVITHGSAAGGVSAQSVSYFNRAVDCVVYGEQMDSSNIGGVIATGGGHRNLAQHCVVSGGINVGAVGGNCDGYTYQASAVDCTVIGVQNIGGFAGRYYTYDLYNSNVTASELDSGLRQTEVRTNMLPTHFAALAGTYSGVNVIGQTNVGGFIGELYRTVSVHDISVSSGVTVQGTTNVGGLFGKFYGWHASTWQTSNRSLYNSATGAEVIGQTNVAGAIGYYTREAGSTTLATFAKPAKGYFYGLLITGNVTGVDNVDILLGAVDPENLPAGETADFDSTDGSIFGFCRVYENSQITTSGHTVSARALLGEYTTYDYVKALPSRGTAEDGYYRIDAYPTLLTLSAANLADENVYFLGRSSDGTYGGMGWARQYWEVDTLQSLYAQQSNPASAEEYEKGIAQNGLVLWLDARNNTDNGYMDPDAVVWKDLSDSHNDAVLHWNNRSALGDASITIADRAGYIRWRNGALEFTSNNYSYYAQLSKSISGYLQGNYTVELIVSYSNPDYGNYQNTNGSNVNAHTSIFGFYDPTGVRGGFRIPYNLGDRSVGLRYNLSANTLWVGTMSTDHSRMLNKTATFRIEKNVGTRYYTNGVLSCSSTTPVNFQNVDSMVWRIGSNDIGSCENARVCGIRVYNRALTETELAQNADYDNWYYFGGNLPTAREIKDADDRLLGTVRAATAQSAAAGFVLNEDGTVTGGTPGPNGYVLLRSEDGSYNGTLVTDSFRSGMKLGSRGYYYLMDSQGKFSNVVKLEGPLYGPRMRTIDLGNEYYDVVANYRFVTGQEGVANASGELNNVLDRLYYGGFRLPDVGTVARPTGATVITPVTRPMLLAVELPGITAYASGIDTVNLELTEDVPAGLVYEIYADSAPSAEDTPVLTGIWPTDSRVLTMTWDHMTPFTVLLKLGENVQTTSWECAELSRTVMLGGDSYWYLFGSDCYTGSSGSEEQTLVTEDDSVEFLHMMNGKLLDTDGNIWDAATAARIGTAEQPFTLKAQAVSLWSGTVDDRTVESYGFHLVSRGSEDVLIKSIPIVFKNGDPYQLQNTKPNNFLVGKYVNGETVSVYGTVLQMNGRLKDGMTALNYPEGFRDRGIRELANNLDASVYNTVALVRYQDGTLAAFDYVTGESIDVVTAQPTVSLFSFFRDTFSGFGRYSLTSGGSGESMRGVEYEQEVASDPSLKNALASLSENKQNTGTVDGEGSGVDTPQPGGQDGDPNPGGVDRPNGGENVSGGDQTVVEGPGSVVDGDFVDGENTENGTGGAPVEPEPVEPEPVEPEPVEPEPVEPEPVEPEPVEPEPVEPEPVEPEPAEPEPVEPEPVEPKPVEPEPVEPQPVEPKPVEPEPVEPKPVEPEPVAEPEHSGENRYITVFDSDSGTSSVYDLKEFLSTPDEELVSQEERSEQLKKLGFHTTLTNAGQLPKEQANGLLLMYVTAGGTLVLLVCMVVLKRRKVDRKNQNKSK